MVLGNVSFASLGGLEGCGDFLLEEHGGVVYVDLGGKGRAGGESFNSVLEDCPVVVRFVWVWVVGKCVGF